MTHPPPKNSWITTPLIQSDILSAKLGCNVFLKLENMQPTHSFKQRSVGLLAREELKRHGPLVHLVIASGGNAALALAEACRQLGIHCTVVVPTPSASKAIIDVLERMGATVVVYGQIYTDALLKAEELVASDSNYVMVSPYNHPTLWKGASSMIDEIAEQLPVECSPPAAVLGSVGGGSMLAGLIIGCERHKWNDTRIVAIETEGSDNFYYSVLATESSEHEIPARVSITEDPVEKIQVGKLVPTSRATSLGSSSPAPALVRMAVERRKQGSQRFSVVNIPDELAMLATLEFAEQHKMLVELACGATLAPAYSTQLFSGIFGSGFANSVAEKRPTIVFIICGGFKISFADMLSHRTHLTENLTNPLRAAVDGETFNVGL